MAHKPKEPDFRMVLVGKTGAGKSATGNTILGREAFKSKRSASSLTSTCQKGEAEFEGKLLAVVDTPGLFDTKRPEEVKKEIPRCISFSAPGPHVFLVVIQPGRFTKEEQDTIKLIQKLFGKESSKYTMVLFTYGDDLEADKTEIEEFFKEDRGLSDFISQCGGRYHVFNNRNKDRSQVRGLLKKIHTMVQRNGGSFYTNEMLKKTERAIQETMEKLKRENPGMKPKETRQQAEEEVAMVVVKAAAPVVGFSAAGATAGAFAGPVGAAVGGAVGAVVGGIVSIVTNVCVIQ